MGQYTAEDWLQMERELTRERGLWGPPVGSDLDKWILDMTEGFFYISPFFITPHLLILVTNAVLAHIDLLLLTLGMLLFASEGPYRMRKKLVRNYLFYQHYPYKPSSADLSTVSNLLARRCAVCCRLLVVVCAGNIMY